MIKMIIADDESVIIRGIRKLLDWQSMGIEIVGEYTDGKQGLDGILALKPDIALLDISMPGLTGIDVLRELGNHNARTSVIFISGFQDFEYAKSAVRFGAKDYLLKPIIRGELLAALERCVPIQNEKEPLFSTEKDYSLLLGMEKNHYVTLTAHPLFGDTDEHLKKLKQFSLMGALEESLKSDHAGILFEKDENTVIVLKGMERDEALSYITALEERLFENTDIHICFLAAGLTDSLSQVRSQYELCLSQGDLPFFAGYLKKYCFDLLSSPAPQDEKEADEKERLCRQMEELLLSQKQEEYEKAYLRLCRCISRTCSYSRENACYQFLSTLGRFADRLSQARISCPRPEEARLLAEGIALENYQQMTELFRSSFLELFQAVKKQALSSGRREIDIAADYIEEHYAEPLTLEILAGVVHMNPYYFSSYFKKNMGINFKDYLGTVRLRHAMTLLVSTDRMTYDIAAACGFPDARAFSDLFQKTYGEKPSKYRKRLRENQP